jgi:DNA-binding NarL/FixJ family response regulator
MLSRPGDLRGLTEIELRILGLFVDGWPGVRIAAALGTTAYAVAAHLERIAEALDTPNRIAAAVGAVRAGLYVPSELCLLDNGAEVGHGPAAT